MKSDESKYLTKLTRLGCIVCRALYGAAYEAPDPSLQLTIIHHFRHGEGRCRAENWLAIPLCVACHTGTHGIHGDKGILKSLKWSENDLLAATIQLYHETYGV